MTGLRLIITVRNLTLDLKMFISQFIASTSAILSSISETNTEESNAMKITIDSNVCNVNDVISEINTDD